MSHNYQKGDWEIDKKPIDKLVGISGDAKDIDKLDKEAAAELGTIDESSRYGNDSAKGLATSIIQKQQQQQQQIQQQQKGLTNFQRTQFVTNEALLNEMPRFLDYLLSEDLEKNDPINFDCSKL